MPPRTTILSNLVKLPPRTLIEPRILIDICKISPQDAYLARQSMYEIKDNFIQTRFSSLLLNPMFDFEVKFGIFV